MTLEEMDDWLSDVNAPDEIRDALRAGQLMYGCDSQDAYMLGAKMWEKATKGDEE